MSNTLLKDFLGADNVEDMRKRIVDVIVEQVREELHGSYHYIIDPDDVNSELFDRIVSQVVDELKAEYSKAIKEAVAKKFGKLIEIE